MQKKFWTPCLSHTVLFSVLKIQPVQSCFLERYFQVFLLLECSPLTFWIVFIFIRSHWTVYIAQHQQEVTYDRNACLSTQQTRFWILDGKVWFEILLFVSGSSKGMQCFRENMVGAIPLPWWHLLQRVWMAVPSPVEHTLEAEGRDCIFQDPDSRSQRKYYWNSHVPFQTYLQPIIA